MFHTEKRSRNTLIIIIIIINVQDFNAVSKAAVFFYFVPINLTQT